MADKTARTSDKRRAVDRLLTQIVAAGLPTPEPEFCFAPVDEAGKPVRRWRADLAWPSHQLLLEVDGSFYVGGRHGGARSAHRDLEKRQAQVLLGWRALHTTPTDVRSGRALALLEVAFGHRPVGEIL